MLPAMPLQQISVTPLDWQKECQRASVSEHNWKCKQEPVYTATVGPERCTSQASTLSNTCDICRICHCEGEPDSPLFAPCCCSGSLRYVHQECLQQWIKYSDIRCCELCKFEFIMQSRVKPFLQWELLELSSLERRRLFCSLLFHFTVIICSLWSLYVLYDRLLEEVNTGSLQWDFWAKLIVVTLGFSGGFVFVAMQCRLYVQMCRRWRAFNRVIYVQNAPEKVALEPSPTPSHITSQESLLITGTCCGSVPVNTNAATAAAPVRSVSVLDLSDDAKRIPHTELPPESVAFSVHDVAVIPIEHIPLTLDDMNHLNDIAPPPVAFLDPVDDADPPSPILPAPSPSSATPAMVPLGSSFSFPLSRMDPSRLQTGYPLLLSTFHPCTPGRRFRGFERPEPTPDSRIPPMGEDVAVTIRPWTVGGSYFLHPSQSGHGLSERWIEPRGAGVERRDSLPVEAVSTSVLLAAIVCPERGKAGYS